VIEESEMCSLIRSKVHLLRDGIVEDAGDGNGEKDLLLVKGEKAKDGGKRGIFMNGISISLAI
jgi:hypothetical protein